MWLKNKNIFEETDQIPEAPRDAEMGSYAFAEKRKTHLTNKIRMKKMKLKVI